MKLDEVGWKDHSGRNYIVGDKVRYKGINLRYIGVHEVMNEHVVPNVVPIFIDSEGNRYYVKAEDSAAVKLGRRIVGFLDNVVLLGLPSTVRSIKEILRKFDVSALTAYPAHKDLEGIKPDEISEYFDRFGAEPLPAESLERVTEDDGDLETKIEERLREFLK